MKTHAAAIVLLALFATSPAGALRALPSPTVRLARALACDSVASAKFVLDAIETLGKPGTNAGDYILDNPLVLFGLPVTHITVTESADTSAPIYTAKFPDADISEVVAAARLTLRAGGYMRDTDDGRLSVDMVDHVVVGLSCAPWVHRAASPFDVILNQVSDTESQN